MRRRALGLFLAALSVAAIAFTSRWWLPTLAAFLGFVEDNSDLIGGIEGLVSIVHILGTLVFAALSYLGIKSLRKPVEDRGSAPSVNISEGSRSNVVSGNVNQGAAVAGDNARVSVEISNVSYGYSDVASSSTDPTELEESLRRLEELPLEYVPEYAELSSNSVMPIRRNKNFVGRDEQLKRVATALKGGETTAIGEAAVAASSGLGGVGKTQLASEFVHWYGQFFHSVYWISFAVPDGVPGRVASCGGAGGMNLRSDFHTLPLEERVKAVMAAWQSGLPRLLVFDNCESDELLHRWLPPVGGSRILVTSRKAQWDPLLGVIELPLNVLERDKSIELLRKYRPDLPPSSKELDAIAEQLGDLPLALDLAGRYLRRYQYITDPALYMRELKSERTIGHRSLQEVGRTFAVSIRQLENGDNVDLLAVELLARAARFAPEEPIDRRLLLSTLGSADDEDPSLQQLEEHEDALTRLVALGLIRQLESGNPSMHVLVAEAAHQEIEEDGAQASVERSVAMKSMKIIRSRQPVRLEPLIPHLRQVISTSGNYSDEPAYLVRFAMGHALLALRYPAEATSYLQSALEYNEALLQASTDPEERQNLVWLVMRQRNDLAVAFKRSGDLYGALESHEELLKERRKNLPQPHEDVASTLTNIGALKAELRLLHEILPPYEEALDIRKAVLAQKEDEDPEKIQLQRDVAESHGNLGAFYTDLGRPHQAASHYRRAVDIHEEDLEETEDEAYANYAMGLGTQLRLLEDFNGARSYLERSLRTHRLVLPEKDTQIVKNLTLLGTLLVEEAKREGKCADERRKILSDACERLDEALEHLCERWGENHPLTAGVMRSAADVAAAEGRQEDAEPLYAKADAIQDDVLQEADVGFIGESFESLSAYGLFEEAVPYGRRALKLRRTVPEDSSLETAQAELDLGLFLPLVRRGPEAERHLQKALNIREEVLGPKDPATDLVKDCLIYLRQGER